MHCSAAEFCAFFVQFAKDQFGDEYVGVLKSWRLDTSEKLGRVIYVLVRRSLYQARYPDRESDFEGQFDFSSVSPQPSVASVYPYPSGHLPQILDPYSFSLGTLLIAVTLVAVLLGLMVISAR
jgi:hypothetical protein